MERLLLVGDPVLLLFVGEARGGRQPFRLPTALTRPQLRLHLQEVPVALHHEQDSGSRGAGGEGIDQLIGALDLPIPDRDDPITGAQLRLLGGGAGQDLVDDRRVPLEGDPEETGLAVGGRRALLLLLLLPLELREHRPQGVLVAAELGVRRFDHDLLHHLLQLRLVAGAEDQLHLLLLLAAQHDERDLRAGGVVGEDFEEAVEALHLLPGTHQDPIPDPEPVLLRGSAGDHFGDEQPLIFSESDAQVPGFVVGDEVQIALERRWEGAPVDRGGGERGEGENGPGEGQGRGATGGGEEHEWSPVGGRVGPAIRRVPRLVCETPAKARGRAKARLIQGRYRGAGRRGDRGAGPGRGDPQRSARTGGERRVWGRDRFGRRGGEGGTELPDHPQPPPAPGIVPRPWRLPTFSPNTAPPRAQYRSAPRRGPDPRSGPRSGNRPVPQTSAGGRILRGRLRPPPARSCGS